MSVAATGPCQRQSGPAGSTPSTVCRASASVPQPTSVIVYVSPPAPGQDVAISSAFDGRKAMGCSQ